MIAALGAAASLAKVGYGMYQQSQLKDIKDVDLTVQDEQTAALKNASKMAGMKELQSEARVRDRLRASTANTVGNLREMGGGAAGMGAVTNAYANEQSQLGNLAIQSDQNWAARQGDYRGELNRMAQTKAFNEQNAQSQANAKQAANAQKEQQSIQNISGGLTEGIQNYANIDALNKTQEQNSELNDARIRQLQGSNSGVDAGGDGVDTGGNGVGAGENGFPFLQQQQQQPYSPVMGQNNFSLQPNAPVTQPNPYQFPYNPNVPVTQPNQFHYNPNTTGNLINNPYELSTQQNPYNINTYRRFR